MRIYFPLPGPFGASVGVSDSTVKGVAIWYVRLGIWSTLFLSALGYNWFAFYHPWWFVPEVLLVAFIVFLVKKRKVHPRVTVSDSEVKLQKELNENSAAAADYLEALKKDPIR